MSQIRAMTVEARQDRGGNFEAEQKLTRPGKGRGTWFETEAVGCRGRAETETGKKTASRQLAASRTTSLQCITDHLQSPLPFLLSESTAGKSGMAKHVRSKLSIPVEGDMGPT